jgi:hypothetical protein
MQNEELKKVLLELDESRDKSRDLYDFVPVGYFTLTNKGIITQVRIDRENPHARRKKKQATAYR